VPKATERYRFRVVRARRVDAMDLEAFYGAYHELSDRAARH
jgi:hypothetical protein